MVKKNSKQNHKKSFWAYHLIIGKGVSSYFTHIQRKAIQAHFVLLKKNQFDQVELKKLRDKILALKIELTAGEQS